MYTYQNKIKQISDTNLAKANIQRSCIQCEDEEVMQRKEANEVPVIQADIKNNLQGTKGSGEPLNGNTRQFMESRMGTDFSNVRIHTGQTSEKMNRDISARAFTHGSDIYFNRNEYQPESNYGKKLLAHELTHVIQQKGSKNKIQRDGPGPRGGVRVHSPVVDEALTQISDIHGSISGRGLFTREISLAENVFGNSIDYSQVRIIETGIAAGTTAGNNIRLPDGFDISSQENAQLLIHELTHVWQYQHFGSGYITTSLLQQLHAGISRGNRNFAYDYTITSGDSFFDFAPEQQAFIVENYFAMSRDQGLIASRPAELPGDPLIYRSNHLASNGFRTSLSAADRTNEINTELPLHEPLIRQMSSTEYRSSLEIMHQRQSDLLIQQPGQDFMPTPDMGGLPPVQTVNIFEVRF